jgi:multidrug resistance efflux pump
VRADVVELAPDVSGPVVQVFAHDDEPVHAGDPLFQIDPVRFVLALSQAQAQADSAGAAMRDAKRTAERYAQLSNNAVSAQMRDSSSAQALEA